MADIVKVKIKLGNAEFEAEGPAEMVQSQYDMFLKAQAAGLQAAPVIPPKPTENTENIPPKPPTAEIPAGDELLSRAFSVEADVVTLRVLPKADPVTANTLLLLLYGYKKLRGQEGIIGSQLAKAAKKSGIEVERMDRALGPYESLTLAAGVGRGRGYSLNNPGILKAEEILKSIFQ